MTYDIVKLGDIASINSESYSLKENWAFVNYLDTGNITENIVAEIQHIEIGKEKLPSRAKRKVKYNSIIYSTVRPNQKHYGIINEQPDNFLVSTGFVVIDIDMNKASADYIYFVLTQESVIEYLHAIAEQSTSAYPSIKPSDLENIEIPLPSLEYQKRIASILIALNRKIDINTRINNNLEQQVIAIFDNIFGDLVSDASLFMPMGKIADLKYGTMPKKDKIQETGYPIFSGYKVVGYYPEKMFDNPQIIIVARGVGGCGEVKFTPKDCYLTNLSIAIIPSDLRYELYMFYYLKQQDMKMLNTGSAQPQITISSLMNYNMPIPNIEDIETFNSLAVPFVEMIRKNEIEAKILSTLRNFLLPKLMSGEIDVFAIQL